MLRSCDSTRKPRWHPDGVQSSTQSPSKISRMMSSTPVGRPFLTATIGMGDQSDAPAWIDSSRSWLRPPIGGRAASSTQDASSREQIFPGGSLLRPDPIVQVYPGRMKSHGRHAVTAISADGSEPIDAGRLWTWGHLPLQQAQSIKFALHTIVVNDWLLAVESKHRLFPLSPLETTNFASRLQVRFSSLDGNSTV